MACLLSPDRQAGACRNSEGYLSFLTATTGRERKFLTYDKEVSFKTNFSMEGDNHHSLLLTEAFCWQLQGYRTGLPQGWSGRNRKGFFIYAALIQAASLIWAFPAISSTSECGLALII